MHVHVLTGELPESAFLGKASKYAASSCREIALRKPNASSGYYYLNRAIENDPFIAYCELEHEFVPKTRGWTRLGLFNMTNPDQVCPSGFDFYQSQSRRLCRRNTANRGYTSVYYGTPILWRQLCGRVVALSERTVDGWTRYGCSCNTINDPYVDGISITMGNVIRRHIWSSLKHVIPSFDPPPPAFVGNNYDTQLMSSNYWFCTNNLDEPIYVGDGIEVRVCRDQTRGDEDVLLEHIELYVH